MGTRCPLIALEAAQHQVVLHRHGAEQLALLGHQGHAQHHALFQRGRADVLAVEVDAPRAGSTPISAFSRWTCRRRWGRSR
jgi:hypothetical protein